MSTITNQELSELQELADRFRKLRVVLGTDHQSAAIIFAALILRDSIALLPSRFGAVHGA